MDPLHQETVKNKESVQKLQLLIDIKSDAKSTLKFLLESLKKYPGLTNNDSVTFVIPENRPPVEDYANYPDFILFDYQRLKAIENTAYQKKIALISLPFHKYSKWDGIREMSNGDSSKIKEVVERAHSYHKPFRFWATPDTELAWRTFARQGVDFIITDTPAVCSKYFGKLKKEHR